MDTIGNKEIAENFRRMADDSATVDSAILVTRLLAEKAAALGEAASWRARYEHAESDLDRYRNRAAFYKSLAEKLAEDLARLSTELVRVRGLSSLAQVIPGPIVPEAGSIDAELARQQQQSKDQEP